MTDIIFQLNENLIQPEYLSSCCQHLALAAMNTGVKNAGVGISARSSKKRQWMKNAGVEIAAW